MAENNNFQFDRPQGPDKLPFEAYRMAREKYIVDPVTGGLNRAGFFEETKKAIEKSKHPENLAFIVLDLNDFKNLNDNQGHPVGDLALRSTEEFLEAELRESDIFGHTRGRTGGDEFVILADLTPREDSSNQTKEERLTALIQRLREKYPAAMLEKSELFRNLSLSAGGAMHSVGAPPEETIKTADDNMYIDKREGKQATGESTS